MVCSGREREVIGVSNMENGSSQGGGGGGEERSLKAPLHNFKLPSFLKWGHQRQLRCVKLPGESFKRDGFGRRKRITTAKAPAYGGIKAVREENVLDLENPADGINDAIFRKEYDCFSSGAAAEEERRWDLRRRVTVVSGKGVYPGPEVVAGVAAGGGRRVGGGGGGNLSPMRKGEKEEEEKRRKMVVVGLTRKEVEDDFIQMVGHRLPRRPKKRPRNVQLRLDTLFPGLWLTEVTADTYKVPDPPHNNGKKYQ